ncbi:MAG: alpha/beta hydrolase, partial [Comamonadaceae bacterium]|nr:alpha/beta hydrolase [Comamonadaceae bacterium]
MEHVEAQFAGCAGVAIHTRSWLVRPARASVVVVHGLGEHGGRYAHVAQALGSLGCA